MTDRIQLTKSFVARKLSVVFETNNDTAARAILANLRRGIGREPGAIPSLWSITLEGLPEELLSRDGSPTFGEWASYTALTLFALHQQGHDLKTEPMNHEGVSLGKAVRKLVKTPEEEARIKRRFDAVLTADTMVEFATHIRGLIQLLKADGIELDYPALAADLYLLQTDSAKDRVRLRWGQDFCHRFDLDKDEVETK